MCYILQPVVVISKMHKIVYTAKKVVNKQGSFHCKQGSKQARLVYTVNKVVNKQGSLHCKQGNL